MTLTLLTCENHIRHAIGGPMDPLVPVEDVVNLAGEWLVSIKAWNWLRRQPYTLTCTADQSYVELPDDFGKLHNLYASDNNTPLDQVTFEEIDELRSGIAVTGSPRSFALGYVEGPPPTPVLELYPTPSSAETLVLRYSAGWTPIDDDSEIDIPPWLHLQFLEAVRVMALGFEEHDNATCSARLQEIARSEQMMYAKAKDGMSQSVLGQLRNGAAQMQRGWYHNFTIEGPA